MLEVGKPPIFSVFLTLLSLIGSNQAGYSVFRWNFFHARFFVGTRGFSLDLRVFRSKSKGFFFGKNEVFR